MQDSDETKKVTTAHRKVRSSGARNRRNMKRPTKILDKSGPAEKVTVVKKSKKQNKAKAKAAKPEVKIARKPVEKITGEASKEPAKKPAEKPGAKKIERFIDAQGETTESRILVRKAQYGGDVEKKETTKPVAQAEQITVRKVTPEPTAQENLENQAEFWSELESKRAADAMVIRPKRPEPLNLAQINERMRARTIIPEERPKIPAKELKERAIEKAVASAAKVPDLSKKEHLERTRFTWGRVLLALSCTIAMVFAIIYFVNLSSPDVSLKVAAMQSGIQATYPSFTPRDYSLSDITSEDGRITLTFRYNDGKSSYTIIEEKSSWDSSALLSNYIRPEYGDNYTAVREQGLTLYMTDNSAVWVNGGVMYKLKINSGSLTKKQMKSIAVSL